MKVALLGVRVAGVLIAALALVVTDAGETGERAEAGARPASEQGPAAPTEGPVKTLATGSSLGTPAVAFDPVVGTVAVWPHGGALEYRIRPPGRAWQPKGVLSLGHAVSESSSAMVATDGHGTVVVAWVRGQPGGKARLITARRSPSEPWSSPKLVWKSVWDVSGTGAIIDPRLAVGGDGSTMMAWTTQRRVDPNDDSAYVTHARLVYRPSGGHWQPVRSLGLDTGLGDVDIDDNGVAVLVLYDGASSLMRCDRGGCIKGEELSEDWPSGTGVVDVEVSRDGRSTSLLLSHMVFEGDGSVVLATHRDDSSSWSAPVRVSPPPQHEAYYDSPRQVMHDRTTTILVTGWRVGEFPGPVQVITHQRGEGYSDPLTITVVKGGDRTPLGVWANEDGAALAVWGRQSNGANGWTPTASYRPSGDAAWSDPIALTLGAHAMVVDYNYATVVAATVYPNGDALSLWFDGEHISMRRLP